MWGIILAIGLLICPSLVYGIGNPIVPCYFIFGDSLSDVGNNNALDTAAKANYAPYGVDFFGGATGRFTNGRTTVDVLGELLGFQGYIAPFSDVEGPELLKGVNYASGASGIRSESGSHLGNRMSLEEQLKNHLKISKKLELFVDGSVTEYLNKCLYTVDIGSNDYINNYFMPKYYPTQRTYNPQQYATLLVDQYTQQLQVLYENGARKVAVFGIGQLGCIPMEVLSHNATQCVEEINQAVIIFNQKLLSIIDQINSQLPGAKFTFINTFTLQLPLPQGFITSGTCCKLRLDYQCERYIEACKNRNQYAFMDGFHPTEIVNIGRANAAFSSPDLNFVHPFNISRLASN